MAKAHHQENQQSRFPDQIQHDGHPSTGALVSADYEKTLRPLARILIDRLAENGLTIVGKNIDDTFR